MLEDILGEKYKNIIEDIRESGLCDTLVHFGSSVYSDNFHDVDLLLYIKNDLTPQNYKDYMTFVNMMNTKYRDVAFSFSSGEFPIDKKHAKFQISLVPYCHLFARNEKDFVDDIRAHSNNIFGEDFIDNIPKPDIQCIYNYILSVEDNSCDSYYDKVKSLLRAALKIREITPRREYIVSEFIKSYNTNLPFVFVNYLLTGVFDNKEIVKNEFKCFYEALKTEILDSNSLEEYSTWEPEFIDALKMSRSYRQLWNNSLRI